MGQLVQTTEDSRLEGGGHSRGFRQDIHRAVAGQPPDDRLSAPNRSSPFWAPGTWHLGWHCSKMPGERDMVQPSRASQAVGSRHPVKTEQPMR